MVGTGNLARLLTRLQRGVATAGRDAGSAEQAVCPAPISRAACPRVRATAASAHVAGSGSTLFPNGVACNADAQPVAHPGAGPLAGSSSGGSSPAVLPAHAGRGIAE